MPATCSRRGRVMEAKTIQARDDFRRRPARGRPPGIHGSGGARAAVSRAPPPYFLPLFLSGTPANELMDTWLFFLTVLALALFLYDLLLLEDLLFL